jgi:hypothetical protein
MTHEEDELHYLLNGPTLSAFGQCPVFYLPNSMLFFLANGNLHYGFFFFLIPKNQSVDIAGQFISASRCLAEQVVRNVGDMCQR